MTAGAPGFGWRGPAAYLACYDFELPLSDALDDPELDPVRRALAALGMGTGLDDGHLAAAELLEAACRLTVDRRAGISDGEGRGAAELRAILQAECDDYQRALWFAVSRLQLTVAVDHLRWLTDTMGDRAGMFRAVRASGAAMPMLPGSQALFED